MYYVPYIQNCVEIFTFLSKDNNQDILGIVYTSNF